MTAPKKIKIILDTDIADDIDDAVALSFALGSPEFELLGVTVVYGDVETRAKVARKLLTSWGREDIPVRLGFERPLGYDYTPGTFPEVCSQGPAVAGEPPLDSEPRNACQFIIDCARRYPGEVYVVTIGAMTNVAAALDADRKLVQLLAGVVSSAGRLYPCPIGGWVGDWNISYDPLAARCLARSGVPWTLVGGDYSSNGLKPPDLAALKASGRPSAEFLLELILLWKRNKFGQDVKSVDEIPNVNVWDAFSLVSFLCGERMRFLRGRIEVNSAGVTAFTPDENGPHRCPTACIKDGSYREEILLRLLGKRLV